MCVCVCVVCVCVCVCVFSVVIMLRTQLYNYVHVLSYCNASMFYNSYFMRHFTSTCFILEFFKEKIHYVQQSLDTVHVFSNTQFISFELFKLSF